MRLKYETAWRVLLFLLLITWAWSLWAGSQSQTNSATDGRTNRTSALVRTIEKWGEDPLTFKLDEIPWLRDTFFLRQPLWKYAASAVYIFLAFYLSKLLDWVARLWLKRVSRTPSRIKELLLQLLRGPIKIVLFVVLLHIGLNLFEWPPTAKSYFSKALILAVAGSLTYLAVKVVVMLLEIWRQRTAPGADQKFESQLFSLLRKSLIGFVIVVGALVTAQNLNVNITAAVASLSIGGLAVGLAAQDTLANLFGAVAVLVDKPFQVGDQIKVEANEGIVESVGLRSTRIRHAEGYMIAVPNKTMGNASITNYTRRHSIKTTMNLALPQTLPLDKTKRALAILHEVYRNHPMTQDLWVSFHQFGGAKLNVMLIHWWNGTDYQQYLAGMQELNLAAKERLDAEGIAFS